MLKLLWMLLQLLVRILDIKCFWFLDPCLVVWWSQNSLRIRLLLVAIRGHSYVSCIIVNQLSVNVRTGHYLCFEGLLCVLLGLLQFIWHPLLGCLRHMLLLLGIPSRDKRLVLLVQYLLQSLDKPFIHNLRLVIMLLDLLLGVHLLKRRFY